MEQSGFEPDESCLGLPGNLCLFSLRPRAAGVPTVMLPQAGRCLRGSVPIQLEVGDLMMFTH